MDKDIVMGMTATFLLWTAAMLFASSKLICSNVNLYRNWSRISRDVRVKMALWLAIPLFMGGILWMRSVAFFGYTMGYYVSSFGLSQAIGYMFIVLFALALSLWWVCDRSYATRHGTAYADLVWCRVMWAGVTVGIVATFISWWY